MASYLYKIGILAAILSSLILYSGCLNLKPSPDITRYYTLSNTYKAQLTHTEPKGLILGIRKIELPGYLESPRIVTRYNEYELDYSEHHRWVEPIDQIIGHLLQDSLKAAQGIDIVSIFPWPKALDYDYTIKINLQRFEALENNRALLQAQWTLLKGNSSQILIEEETSIISEWDGENYAVFAEAMSEACGKFIREIETTLESLIQQNQ